MHRIQTSGIFPFGENINLCSIMPLKVINLTHMNKELYRQF